MRSKQQSNDAISQSAGFSKRSLLSLVRAWMPLAMALLLQGGQIPFRSQQEIQARLQSRDAVDEQEQMHARDGQSEIERRAGVTGKGFVQHGAKLVFGEAADPIEGHRASSLANDLCGRDSRLGRRRVKRPCCVR